MTGTKTNERPGTRAQVRHEQSTIDAVHAPAHANLIALRIERVRHLVAKRT